MNIRILILVLFCSILPGCVEPFEVEIEDFENILVINTTVTNEVKHQQVLLTRTFKFGDSGPLSEQGATVKIIEDATTEYLFEELSPGVYRSVQEFGASAGKEYQLSIKTLDGKSYISDKVTLPQDTPIDRVYPKRIVNDKEVEGIGILVDTFDPTGNSTYYRYEFEETYKVNAPFWHPFDLIVVAEGEEFFEFGLIPRPESQRVCYATNVSNNIKLTNTTSLTEDRIIGLEVNFIPAQDIRIEDRYSILVKQYVQSREAYGFYETLSSFSESENLFSQIQPGFITGNIVSEDNPRDQVLGFFDVSSFSEQRIFIDRNDLIEDLPKFALECELLIPESTGDNLITFHERMRDFINSDQLRYFPDPNSIPDAPPNLFVFMPRACGDCTALGNSEAPDFWED